MIFMNLCSLFYPFPLLHLALAHKVSLVRIVLLCGRYNNNSNARKSWSVFTHSFEKALCSKFLCPHARLTTQTKEQMSKPDEQTFQGSSQFTETFLSSEEEKWAKIKILTSWDWLLNLFSSFLSIDFQGDEIFRSTKLELSHISLLILFYRDLLSFRQVLMFSAHDFNEFLQFLNFLGLNY